MSNHDTCVNILYLHRFICKITHSFTYLNYALSLLTYQIKRGQTSRLPFPGNALKNNILQVMREETLRPNG